MRYTIEVTKQELDLLLRGVRAMLVDECTQIDKRRLNRGGLEFKPTKNYQAASDLEDRLSLLFGRALQAGEVQR